MNQSIPKTKHLLWKFSSVIFFSVFLLTYKNYNIRTIAGNDLFVFVFFIFIIQKYKNNVFLGNFLENLLNKIKFEKQNRKRNNNHEIPKYGFQCI